MRLNKRKNTKSSMFDYSNYVIYEFNRAIIQTTIYYIRIIYSYIYVFMYNIHISMYIKIGKLNDMRYEEEWK